MNRIVLTMGTKQFLYSCLLAATTCTAASQTSFGIASMNGDGHLTVVSASPLDPATTLQVQFPDKESRPQCCKRLKAGDLKPDSRRVSATNQLTGEPAYSYQGDIPSDWTDMPFIGIAAFGNVRSVKSSAERLLVKDPAGKRSWADLCVSSEGVHLTEKRGGRLATHLYLSLGYDVESPTCRNLPTLNPHAPADTTRRPPAQP